MSFIVEIPYLYLKRRIEVKGNSTGKDVVLALLSSLENDKSVEITNLPVCSLTARVKKKVVRIDLTRPMRSYGFPPKQVLWLHGTVLSLTVEVRGEVKRHRVLSSSSEETATERARTRSVKRMKVTVNAFATVNDLLRRIYRHSLARGLPNNYALYLVPFHSNKPLKLEASRVLLFTRIGELDTLVFQHTDAEQLMLQRILKTRSEVLVTVRCREIGAEHTLQVPASTTLKELQSKFEQKHNLEKRVYAMYSPEYTCTTPLSPLLDLTSFNLRLQPHISFELRRPPAAPPRPPRRIASLLTEREGAAQEEQPCAIYGIDPTTMQQTVDQHVPLVLEQMRSWMEREGGFQEEGVFRLAGNQRTMEELESRLCPAGNDIETLMKETDGTVHDVATIMKRFFKMLPTRVFASVTEAQFDEYGEGYLDNVSYGADAVIDGHLPAEMRSLYIWLLFTLAEVASSSEATKMDPYNLGVVIGPCLVPLEHTDPIAAFRRTNQAAAMVACSMSRFVLSKWNPEEDDFGDPAPLDVSSGDQSAINAGSDDTRAPVECAESNDGSESGAIVDIELCEPTAGDQCSEVEVPAGPVEEVEGSDARPTVRPSAAVPIADIAIVEELLRAAPLDPPPVAPSDPPPAVLATPSEPPSDPAPKPPVDASRALLADPPSCPPPQPPTLASEGEQQSDAPESGEQQQKQKQQWTTRRIRGESISMSRKGVAIGAKGQPVTGTRSQAHSLTRVDGEGESALLDASGGKNTRSGFEAEESESNDGSADAIDVVVSEHASEAISTAWSSGGLMATPAQTKRGRLEAGARYSLVITAAVKRDMLKTWASLESATDEDRERLRKARRKPPLEREDSVRLVKEAKKQAVRDLVRLMQKKDVAADRGLVKTIAPDTLEPLSRRPASDRSVSSPKPMLQDRLTRPASELPPDRPPRSVTPMAERAEAILTAESSEQERRGGEEESWKECGEEVDGEWLEGSDLWEVSEETWEEVVEIDCEEGDVDGLYDDLYGFIGEHPVPSEPAPPAPIQESASNSRRTIRMDSASYPAPSPSPPSPPSSALDQRER